MSSDIEEPLTSKEVKNPEEEDMEEDEEDEDDAQHSCRDRLRRVIKSWRYSVALALVCMLDLGLIIIMEVDLSLVRGIDPVGLILFFIECSNNLLFVIEIFIRVGVIGPGEFFQGKDRWVNIRNTVECIATALATIVNIIEFASYFRSSFLRTNSSKSFVLFVSVFVVTMRVIKLVMVLYNGIIEAKAVTRKLISADRRRYNKDGYDLDLTYITPRIIAMSWPSTQVEALYRNNIIDVVDFLDTNHDGKYVVYPLCAEREYSAHYFHNRVHPFKLEDHNPCDLSIIIQFLQDVRRWMEVDESNVIVVHCKGGKGRTGTMICSWLLYSRYCLGAGDAMKHFGEKRSSESARKIQGVESPSQDRYVRYISSLCNKFSRIPLMLWSELVNNHGGIRLESIVVPVLPKVGGSELILRIVNGSSNDPLYQSIECDLPKTPSNITGKKSSIPCKFGNYTATLLNSGILQYLIQTEQIFMGDLQFEFFYKTEKKRLQKAKYKKLFSFWLHTYFIQGSSLTLSRVEIDGCHKDSKCKVFPSDFSVVVQCNALDNQDDDIMV